MNEKKQHGVETIKSWQEKLHKKEKQNKNNNREEQAGRCIQNLQIGCLTRVILFVCNFGVLRRVPFKPTGAFEKTDFYCRLKSLCMSL